MHVGVPRAIAWDEANQRPPLLACLLLAADVLCTMFNQLYDDDIVSDDTFYSWEETGREDLEGRAVTLVVARNFLQWLRSTGEEEGEGTVQ